MAVSAASEEPKFLTLLFSRRTVLIALIVFVVIVLMCASAQLIAPADPGKMSVRARLTPPGEGFLMGADAFGRDVASRLLYAGQVSLTIGLGVAIISSIIGISIGLVADLSENSTHPCHG